MIVRSRMWMSKKKISKKVFKLCICWFQSATLWFFLSLIRICIWDSKNYLGTFLNDKCRLININRVILLNCTACNCLFKYLCIHLYFFVDSNYFIKKETLNITKFMGFFFSRCDMTGNLFFVRMFVFRDVCWFSGDEFSSIFGGDNFLSFHRQPNLLRASLNRSFGF